MYGRVILSLLLLSLLAFASATVPRMCTRGGLQDLNQEGRPQGFFTRLAEDVDDNVNFQTNQASFTSKQAILDVIPGLDFINARASHYIFIGDENVDETNRYCFAHFREELLLGPRECWTHNDFFGVIRWNDAGKIVELRGKESNDANAQIAACVSP